MSMPFVVIGDGWAALAAVGFLAHSGRDVNWIAGSGAKLIAPLPGLDNGSGAVVLSSLARVLQVDIGSFRSGMFLREFKNKSFHPFKSDDLWAPEKRISDELKGRFQIDLCEVERLFRERLSASASIKRWDGIPVTEINTNDGISVMLASGDEIRAESALFADRWTLLSTIKGLPKVLNSFGREKQSVRIGNINREFKPMGVIQVLFTHILPVGNKVDEGFCSITYKEKNEEFDRHVWGYFSAEGCRSVWTLFLTPEETEDNHEIAKKLRKIKQTLNRTFCSPEWLPGKVDEFLQTVREERFRFEDAAVFSCGSAFENPFIVPDSPKMAFATDGFGVSSALVQSKQYVNAILDLPVQEITDTDSL